MANAAPARANALRLTRTDACGVPVDEIVADSRVTTAGFITVDLGADIFTSSDIQVAAASGAICIRSKGVPSLLGYNVTIELCDFNLAVLEMTEGITLLDDGAGEDVGGVVTAGGGFNPNTVMVEWFSLNQNNDACAAGNPYVHFVLPRVSRWTVSGTTSFGDTATNITLTGYADPTQAFAASRAADSWTAADIAAINNDGVLAWKEVATIPSTVASGYDP